MPKSTTPRPPCRYPACLNRADCLTGRFPGYCHGHQAQLRRGKPLRPLKKQRRARPKGMSLQALATYIRNNLVRETSSGCWEFQGHRSKAGYGQIGFQGEMVLAHRLMLMAQGVALKADQMALHTCDHPWCIRPSHLYTGTQADNMRDKCTRGRNPQRKLTRSQAQAIRERYAAGGISQQKLADAYGVHRGTVLALLRGKTYRF